MDPPIPPLARLTARRQGCLRGVQWMRQCEIRLHHVFTHPNWSWEPTFQVLSVCEQGFYKARVDSEARVREAR